MKSILFVLFLSFSAYANPAVNSCLEQKEAEHKMELRNIEEAHTASLLECEDIPEEFYKPRGFCMSRANRIYNEKLELAIKQLDLNKKACELVNN